MLINLDKAEDCYVPGDECKLVNRCLIVKLDKREGEKIHRVEKKTGKEVVGSPHLKKKLKEIRHAV